jgi:hypothetical protein
MWSKLILLSLVFLVGCKNDLTDYALQPTSTKKIIRLYCDKAWTYLDSARMKQYQNNPQKIKEFTDKADFFFRISDSLYYESVKKSY